MSVAYVLLSIIFRDASGHKGDPFVWWKGILVFFYAGPLYILAAALFYSRFNRIFKQVKKPLIQWLFRLGLGFLWYFAFRGLVQWASGGAFPQFFYPHQPGLALALNLCALLWFTTLWGKQVIKEKEWPVIEVKYIAKETAKNEKPQQSWLILVLQWIPLLGMLLFVVLVLASFLTFQNILESIEKNLAQ